MNKKNNPVIEVNAPYGVVDEKVILSLKAKLSRLFNSDSILESENRIRNAEIFFSQTLSKEERKYMCRIKLSVAGEKLFASRTAASFQKASDACIHSLEEMVKGMNENEIVSG